MTRQTDFKDSQTPPLPVMMAAVFIISRSVFRSLLCCVRIIVHGMGMKPDRVMPKTARDLANAAKDALSCISSFLLMVSSSLVRSVYQQNIHPNAGERQVKRTIYGGNHGRFESSAMFADASSPECLEAGAMALSPLPGLVLRCAASSPRALF